MIHRRDGWTECTYPARPTIEAIKAAMRSGTETFDRA
jgi:hypothetical protein